MKVFYGYIRVSTTRQGEHGVSLEHQRDAIARYADKNNLQITKWFEEQETAAKRGRPLFGQMLKALRVGKASGVIIHKIDRSARNLKDWADLGELIDAGLEVHYANGSLDLHSRGGRLSADIQAVVAADYIRNLREETIKGFYGRLKQGLYPRPALIGYVDQGPGLPKLPDPVQAPLIRTLFERYSTGNTNLKAMVPEMHQLGLARARAAERFRSMACPASLTIRSIPAASLLRKRASRFAGVHQPIVGLALFNRVQDILRGKFSKRTQKNSYLFRQVVQCKTLPLLADWRTAQKTHIYYRCHTTGCPTKTVREETLDHGVIRGWNRSQAGIQPRGKRLFQGQDFDNEAGLE